MSQDELGVILDGVADGITVQDQQGRILYANDAAAKNLGFSSAEELTESSRARRRTGSR